MMKEIKSALTAERIALTMETIKAKRYDWTAVKGAVTLLIGFATEMLNATDMFPASWGPYIKGAIHALSAVSMIVGLFASMQALPPIVKPESSDEAA